MTLQTQVLEERAESLAIVLLTRHPDLVVLRQSADLGIDLLVSISKDGGASGRVFGIEVKSTVAPLPNSGRAKNGVGKMLKGSFHLQDMPFPLCMFFFTMEDNKAYWRWVTEPVLTGDVLRLAQNNEPTFQPLTDEAIRHIVNVINKWYDQRY